VLPFLALKGLFFVVRNQRVNSLIAVCATHQTGLGHEVGIVGIGDSFPDFALPTHIRQIGLRGLKALMSQCRHRRCIQRSELSWKIRDVRGNLKVVVSEVDAKTVEQVTEFCMMVDRVVDMKDREVSL
jgi:hypothetical protein